MSRKISYKDAINEAISQEMARDSSVIVMGEDNVGGHGSPGVLDAWGGVLGVTKGLYGKFGDRVMDTPISESAFIGAAIGAATQGMRPVAELMFVDFMGVCFDQILNQAPSSATCSAAKQRLRSSSAPVTAPVYALPPSIRNAYIHCSRTYLESSACCRPLLTMRRGC